MIGLPARAGLIGLIGSPP
uniref:Uncharacterized protein n=1 Tax=Arundo donax TaxID=35708 RepID=A0A0A9BTJ7_ARUDO